MANKIAIKFDSIGFVVSKMKLGIMNKSELHNESKTVPAISLIFGFTNPRLFASLPSNRKTNVFIVSR